MITLQKYMNNSILLVTDTDCLMYKIKTEDVYEDFKSNKEIFEFSSHSTKPKYYHNSTKLVIDKMNNETTSISFKEFVGLKPKIYSFLVEDNAEHKKANVVATISLYGSTEPFCYKDLI